MAGARSTGRRHRHRRRARQGLHDEPQRGAPPTRRDDHRDGARPAHRGRGAGRDGGGAADDHVGDGPAQRRRQARPCRGRGRRHRRLRCHEPDRLPGPPRPNHGLQRVRPARPPWRRSRPSSRGSGSSCSRSSPSPTRSPAASVGTRSTQAGALFIDVGGGTTDVALVRQGSVEGTRMFALGGRAFTKSLADRLDLAFDGRRARQDRPRGRARRRAGGARVGDRGRGRGGLVGRGGARPRGVRQAGPPAGSHRAVRRRRPACPRSQRALEATGLRVGPPVLQAPIDLADEPG